MTLVTLVTYKKERERREYIKRVYIDCVCVYMLDAFFKGHRSQNEVFCYNSVQAKGLRRDPCVFVRSRSKCYGIESQITV